MSKKKKVTAPLTYNPGKGRPKEHLAYLNYQEMQALKRLNGNNQERGPKGLPSFPPADARGSSSKASSTGARGPTGPQGQARSSPAGNKGGAPGSATRTSTTTGARGPTGPQGQARTSPAGGSPGAVSRPSGSGFAGIGGGGGGGARDSGQATARNVTTSRSVTPGRAPSVPSGGGGRDSGTIRQTQISNTKAAEKTPALRDDRSRTLNVGPMGTPVQVRAQPGARISGAIRQAQAPAVRPTTPMATQGTSFASPLDARIENRFRISDARRASDQFRFSEVPSVAEIAADNARRLNAAKMAQQYSQYRSPPGMTPPPAAPQGVFGPRVGQGTDYLKTATMPGMFTEEGYYGPSIRQVPGPEGFYAEKPGSERVPGPMKMRPGFEATNRNSMEGFYAPDQTVYPRANAESTLRAYEEAKRTSPKIQDRVPVSGSLAVGRNAVVPSAPPRALTYGRGTVVPSYPTSGVEDGLYKKPGRDPAVERALAEAGFDPSGRRLQALIDPSIPGRNIEALKNYKPAVGPGGVVGGMVYTRPDLGPQPKAPVDNASYFGDIKQPFFSGWNSVFQREWVDPVKRGVRSLTDSFFDPAGAIPTRGPVDYVDGVPVSGFATMRDPFAPDPKIGRSVQGKSLSTPMASQGSSYATPEEAARALTNFLARETEKVAPPAPSGLPAIPTPDSMGMFAPPVPKMRPADLMDAYGDMKYPGADGITGEDIGGVYGEGDSEGYEGVPGKIGPRSFLNLYSEGLPPGYAERYGLDKERVLEVEDFPEEGVSPADEDRNASPSQGGLTEDQRKKAEKEINRAKPVVRGVTTATGLATGLPLGTVSGFAFKKYKENKLKQLEDYAAMTKAEKRVAEKKNPELVGWANRLGIPSENDYSFYQNWASERGLRAPPSREGGGGGISDIVAGGPSGTSGGTTEPPSTQPPAQSGRRPDIYYMWDLGVNIPSPGAPNYTQYQTYLAERLAAQRAMGYV